MSLTGQFQKEIDIIAEKTNMLNTTELTYECLRSRFTAVIPVVTRIAVLEDLVLLLSDDERSIFPEV